MEQQRELQAPRKGREAWHLDLVVNISATFMLHMHWFSIYVYSMYKLQYVAYFRYVYNGILRRHVYIYIYTYMMLAYIYTMHNTCSFGSMSRGLGQVPVRGAGPAGGDEL